jgi:hypothetical protein
VKPGEPWQWFDMATESRSAAAGNGQQHFDVRPAYLPAIALNESSFCSADQIGQFQPPDLPPALLMDVGFASLCPLAPHRRLGNRIRDSHIHSPATTT